MARKFVQLEQLCHFTFFIHHFSKNVKACRCVKRHFTLVINKNLVGCLLVHDIWADLKIFLEVEEILLTCLQYFLVCLDASTFKLVFEVNLVDVQENFADIS